MEEHDQRFKGYVRVCQVEAGRWEPQVPFREQTGGGHVLILRKDGPVPRYKLSFFSVDMIGVG